MLKGRELRYVLADSGRVGHRQPAGPVERWLGARAVAGTEVTVAITTSPLDYLDDQSAPPRSWYGVTRTAAPRPQPTIGKLLREHRRRAVRPRHLEPDDVALLTYTSGTTGDPKGAMNTGNVVFQRLHVRGG